MTTLTAKLQSEDCNNNDFVFYSSDFTVEITLDRSLSVSDSFIITLYSENLMFLDNADSDNGISHKRKKMTVRFYRQAVWIPGKYFVILRDLTNFAIFRFDMILDKQGKFTVSKARECPQLSDEDALSGPLYAKKEKWRVISMIPGQLQLRQWIVNKQKIELLNCYREQAFSMKKLKVCGNMLVSLRSTFSSGFAYGLMRPSSDEKEELVIPKECRDLYDKTQTNPYECMGTCFQYPSLGDGTNYKHHTFVFRNIGVLLDNGGKYVINYLIEHWPVSDSVVLVGSPEEISTLLNENPSLQDKFPLENRITEQPFTKEEILFAFFHKIDLSTLVLSREAAKTAYEQLTSAYNNGLTASWMWQDIAKFVGSFLTASHVRNSIIRCSKDLVTGSCFVTGNDVKESFDAFLSKSSNDSLSELNSMIGLTEIKQSITTFSNLLRFYKDRRQLGLPSNDGATYHAIFTGSPGTGKTTVARLLGKIYHSLGILSKGEVICADRTNIIGQYIGQTEENMNELLKEARGNILFIDEAYTLYTEDDNRDYGRHAIETLLTVLSRKDPDMVIIFAGYEKEMDSLLQMNPGLASRFPYKLHFPDYTAVELMQIAESILAKDKYELTEEASKVLSETIRETVIHRTQTFGNARWIDQYIHNGIIPALADRLMTSPHVYDRKVYQRIEAGDVRKAYEKFDPRVMALRPHKSIGFKV